MPDKTYRINIETNFNKVSIDQAKLTKSLESSSRVVKSISTDTKKMVNSFESLIGSALPFGDALNDQKKKFEKVSGILKTIGSQGGIFKVMTTYMNELSSTIGGTGKALTGALGGGLQAMIASARAAFMLLIESAATFATSLLPFLPIILGIIAVVFTLKRMWANNVGGMQTYFMRFIGMLKDTWRTFVAMFDKTLRMLGPIFKVIFGIIFVPLLAAVKNLQGLMKGLFAIIQPIIAAVMDTV